MDCGNAKIMKNVAVVVRKIERCFTAAIKVAAITFAAVMVASLLLGVVYRYLLQDSLSWSGEVALLCFTWLVFLTAVLAVKDDSHVRIDLLHKLLPGQVSWILNQLIWLVISLTGAYMVWTGWNLIGFTLGQTSPAIGYPIWMRNVSLPLAGGLIFFYSLGNVRGFRGFQPDAQDVK